MVDETLIINNMPHIEYTEEELEEIDKENRVFSNEQLEIIKELKK